MIVSIIIVVLLLLCCYCCVVIVVLLLLLIWAHVSVYKVMVVWHYVHYCQCIHVLWAFFSPCIKVLLWSKLPWQLATVASDVLLFQIGQVTKSTLGFLSYTCRLYMNFDNKAADSKLLYLYMYTDISSYWLDCSSIDQLILTMAIFL